MIDGQMAAEGSTMAGIASEERQNRPVDVSTREGLAQIDAIGVELDEPERQTYYCGKCGDPYYGPVATWPTFDSPCCGSGAWTTTGPTPLTVRQVYRYQESRYSGGVVMLVKYVYPVVKETDCGVWIDVYGHRRFVRTDARKRFACPTEQEALESYHARKRRQVRILRAQLAAAKAALSLTKEDQTAPVGLLC